MHLFNVELIEKRLAEVKALHEKYINDGTLQALYNAKAKIITAAIPKDIILRLSGVEYIYDDVVNSHLKIIDTNIAEHIAINYYSIITVTKEESPDYYHALPITASEAGEAQTGKGKTPQQKKESE